MERSSDQRAPGSVAGDGTSRSYPAGGLVLAFVALGPAVRVVAGLLRHEGPTPTLVGLSLFLLLLLALGVAEWVRPGGRSDREGEAGKRGR